MLDVIVVTQDDPFYMPIFFRTFLSELPDDVRIDSIVLLDAFDESTLDLARRMLGLYGPVNFVRRGAEFAVRKGLDVTGMGRYSVESVAAEFGVDVTSRSTVNADDFVRRAGDVDVALSVSAPEIFEPEVLEAPSWGCLNVHTSKLPEYRGMLPTFWAMYHGEEEVGVTVHTMVEEIDQGRILRQDTFAVEPDDTLDDVIARGKRNGGALAVRALEAVANSQADLTPMEGEGSYFSFPTVEERREFQRRGNELL